MYCTKCGNSMGIINEPNGYDANTGKPILQEYGYCANCQNKIPIMSNEPNNNKNNVAGNKFVDVIAIISLAFSVFAIMASIKFYVVPFFWLIVYGIWYMAAKSNGKDVSELKKSFYAIFIAFFLGIGIIFIR